jgi:hypothetical protein
MDKALTKVFSGTVFVNKQELDAPNPPSVSQRDTSYCGVNTFERPKKDNKSLLYYGTIYWYTRSGRAQYMESAPMQSVR